MCQRFGAGKMSSSNMVVFLYGLLSPLIGVWHGDSFSIIGYMYILLLFAASGPCSF